MKKRERIKPAVQAARELFEVEAALGNTGPTEWSSTNPSVIMVYAFASSSHERERERERERALGGAARTRPLLLRSGRLVCPLSNSLYDF